MRILPVGYGKTFFTSLSRLFDDFRKTRVKVAMIATDEELMIATDTYNLVE